MHDSVVHADRRSVRRRGLTADVPGCSEPLGDAVGLDLISRRQRLATEPEQPGGWLPDRGLDQTEHGYLVPLAPPGPDGAAYPGFDVRRHVAAVADLNDNGPGVVPHVTAHVIKDEAGDSPNGSAGRRRTAPVQTQGPAELAG